MDKREKSYHFESLETTRQSNQFHLFLWFVRVPIIPNMKLWQRVQNNIVKRTFFIAVHFFSLTLYYSLPCTDNLNSYMWILSRKAYVLVKWLSYGSLLSIIFYVRTHLFSKRFVNNLYMLLGLRRINAPLIFTEIDPWDPNYRLSNKGQWLLVLNLGGCPSKGRRGRNYPMTSGRHPLTLLPFAPWDAEGEVFLNRPPTRPRHVVVYTLWWLYTKNYVHLIRFDRTSIRYKISGVPRVRYFICTWCTVKFHDHMNFNVQSS